MIKLCILWKKNQNLIYHKKRQTLNISNLQENNNGNPYKIKNVPPPSVKPVIDLKEFWKILTARWIIIKKFRLNELGYMTFYFGDNFHEAYFWSLLKIQ